MSENTKQRALVAYLVAAARTNDHVALDRLVRLASPRMLAHAARLLGDTEQARDAVQAAWVEILQGLGGLRDVGMFVPWALRIVSRRVARQIRLRQRDRALAAEWAAETGASEPDGGPTFADAGAVRRAIAALPAQQRATVALFYLEDMSVAEVAMATDVPVGTVKTRLMHARNRLRLELEGENDDQDR
jgi:RNA polymerase sigma-70 factor (ECF subfamily)